MNNGPLFQLAKNTQQALPWYYAMTLGLLQIICGLIHVLSFGQVAVNWTLRFITWRAMKTAAICLQKEAK